MQLFQILRVIKKTKKNNMQKGNTVRHYKTNKHSGMLFTSFFSFMDVADHLFEYVCVQVCVCVCVWVCESVCESVCVCVCVLTELIGLPQCPCMSAFSRERQRGDVFPACPLQGNLRLLRLSFSDWEKPSGLALISCICGLAF